MEQLPQPQAQSASAFGFHFGFRCGCGWQTIKFLQCVTQCVYVIYALWMCVCLLVCCTHCGYIWRLSIYIGSIGSAEGGRCQLNSIIVVFVFAFAFAVHSFSLCLPLLPPLCLLSRINNCHNWFRQSTQHFAVCCSWQRFVAAATRSLQRCQAALSHFLYLSILLHFCSIKKAAQIFDLFDICKRERHLPLPCLPSLHCESAKLKYSARTTTTSSAKTTFDMHREREAATLHSLCIYPCGSLHTCRSSHKSSICNQIHKNTNKAKCQQSCQIYMAYMPYTYRIFLHVSGSNKFADKSKCIYAISHKKGST